jgi:hypothetical protein
MTKLGIGLAAVVCIVLAAILPGLTVGPVATAHKPAVASHASAPAFTKTVTITRDNLVAGVDTVVDTRTVTLDVGQTTNLQGRQEIDVSWSGAHPTGGIVSDQNSINARNEEYPFVLLECRGVDSTSVPAADQVSPETCWTQSWAEHYQDSLGDVYPPYRLDEYASAADRAQIVGEPSPLPTTCKYDENARTQYWVPFVAADGTVYQGGNGGCAGEPPEADEEGTSALPSNETYGVTGLNGSGSSSFDILTSAQNASLGCSQTVSCALVAVPIMGVDCDPSISVPASDVSQCEQTGAFAPGQLMTAGSADDLTVSGSLWWAASNWRNRITVPLSFGVPPDACSVTTTGPSNVVDVYGSELLIQATGQWEPSFCLDKSSNFSFIHVQTGEPEARNLVATGSAEAAFTSYAQPGGYGKPVVNAPVALSGFAISYDIDGADGRPYTSLKLDPRLLAKLLTESYPAIEAVQEDDSALSHNPLDITLDPEFQALNPGITKGVADSEAASELVSLSGDSDVMEALTTYINDDPTARAWLNGTPDQWGMVVNPAYKGIQLPVDQWPLLSTFEPTDYYQSDVNDCLYNSPVPFLPLVSAPLGTLENVSEAIQFDIANSTTICKEVQGTVVGEKLTAEGRQTTGFRFLIGITPLADSERYGLTTAALQTTPGTFVAPSNASLATTVRLLEPDVTTGTWPIPYAKFQTSAGAAAYPGTMLVYAAIPTTGLPTTDAKDYGSLLQFLATTGQTPGDGVGQLPPGYLPLTTADGLGALDAYTKAAATDVTAQNGQVPPVATTTATSPPSTAGDTGGGTTTTTEPPSTVTPPNGGAQSGAGSVSEGGSSTGQSSTGPSHTSDRQPARHQSPVPLVLGRTLGLTLWTGDALLLLLLGLGLLGAVAIPALYVEGRRRGRW